MPEIDAIIKKYGGMVTAISFRMIEDRELAKDAAQEAWIEIIKSLPTFKSKSKLSTWIYTIAVRTIIRHSRNEKKYSVRFISEYLDGDEISYPSDIPEQEELEWTKEKCNKCITGSLHCLSNEERLIYLLYDGAELSSEEIAEILHISPTAIRKKMSRNRKKLHSFLNNQCILYNPKGNCKCRMIKNVIRTDIQKEFERIESDIQEISFIHRSDELLSTYKIFFEELCHKYGFPRTN